MSEKSLKFVQFDSYTFDLESGELSRKGRPVALRPKARKLLGRLFASNGEIVSHNQLYELIWGRCVVQKQDGIHRLIRDIRAGLGGGTKSKEYLENIPGQGYRFRADISPYIAAERASNLQASVLFMTGFSAFPVAFIIFCLLVANA